MRTSPVVAVEVARQLAQSVQKCGRSYRKQLRRCQKNFSADSIHDLRIALRRLIAALDVLRALQPALGFKGTRRRLKRELQSLSQLRDAQIQLDYAETLPTAHPEMCRFLACLRRHEGQLIKKTRQRIKRIRTGGIRLQIRRGLQRFQARFPESAFLGNALSPVRRIVAGAFNQVRARQRQIGPGDPNSLHRLRIAFKKYRYAQEILKSVLPGLTDRRLKALRAVQVRLGQIQDIDVFLGGLRDFDRRRSGSSESSLRGVQRRLRRRLRARITRFMKTADRVITSLRTGTRLRSEASWRGP